MICGIQPRAATSGRVFWLCSLCLFLVGCSGAYQTIPILTNDQDGERHGEEPANLKSGDLIRLTLLDGTRIKGTYVGIRDHNLLVNKAESTYSEAEGFDEIRVTETDFAQTTEFPLAEITVLEKHNSRTTESLVVAGVVIFSLWAMIYAINHPVVDIDFED